MPLPLVAIVGAPNVGKSTLFNRLVGRRQAIVTDEPGVTRDRQYAEVRRGPRPFRLVDTGGLSREQEAPFAREIEQQAQAALSEAAAILFVVDARAGATALDLELASMLRPRRIPLLLVANKIDADGLEPFIHELHDLGLGEALPVSAEHGRGIGDLLDRLDAELGEQAEEPSPGGEEPPAVRVAIVGRPNVGKSSMLNRLLGEQRVLVSEIPGTTRDSVDTLLVCDGRRYQLIDTAGIRRRGKVRRGAERFSVARARQNIERCDVALLVLDASEELQAQDAHVAGYIHDAHKPMLVAVNKWDLIESREEAAKQWADRVSRRLRFSKHVPQILVSAKTGQRVGKILERVDELAAAAAVWVSTAELNRWVGRLQESRTTPGRGFRIFYGTQTGVRPPTFLFFCNDPRRLHFSVRRHIENSLRERFEFGAIPLRLRFRRRREGRAS